MKICKVDEDDRQRVSTELGKCSHPLNTESEVLYNIQNGQVAPTMVNVSDSCIPQLTPNRIPCKAQFASDYYGTSETRCQNW